MYKFLLHASNAEIVHILKYYYKIMTSMSYSYNNNIIICAYIHIFIYTKYNNFQFQSLSNNLNDNNVTDQQAICNSYIFEMLNILIEYGE